MKKMFIISFLCSFFSTHAHALFHDREFKDPEMEERLSISNQPKCQKLEKFCLSFEFQESSNLCSWALHQSHYFKRPLFTVYSVPKDEQIQRLEKKLYHVEIDDKDIEFVTNKFTNCKEDRSRLELCIKNIFLSLDTLKQILKEHKETTFAAWLEKFTEENNSSENLEKIIIKATEEGLERLKISPKSSDLEFRFTPQATIQHELAFTIPLYFALFGNGDPYFLTSLPDLDELSKEFKESGRLRKEELKNKDDLLRESFNGRQGVFGSIGKNSVNLLKILDQRDTLLQQLISEQKKLLDQAFKEKDSQLWGFFIDKYINDEMGLVFLHASTLLHMAPLGVKDGKLEIFKSTLQKPEGKNATWREIPQKDADLLKRALQNSENDSFLKETHRNYNNSNQIDAKSRLPIMSRRPFSDMFREITEKRPHSNNVFDWTTTEFGRNDFSDPEKSAPYNNGSSDTVAPTLIKEHAYNLKKVDHNGIDLNNKNSATINNFNIFYVENGNISNVDSSDQKAQNIYDSDVSAEEEESATEFVNSDFSGSDKRSPYNNGSDHIISKSVRKEDDSYLKEVNQKCNVINNTDSLGNDKFNIDDVEEGNNSTVDSSDHTAQSTSDSSSSTEEEDSDDCYADLDLGDDDNTSYSSSETETTVINKVFSEIATNGDSPYAELFCSTMGPYKNTLFSTMIMDFYKTNYGEQFLHNNKPLDLRHLLGIFRKEFLSDHSNTLHDLLLDGIITTTMIRNFRDDISIENEKESDNSIANKAVSSLLDKNQVFLKTSLLSVDSPTERYVLKIEDINKKPRVLLEECEHDALSPPWFLNVTNSMGKFKKEEMQDQNLEYGKAIIEVRGLQKVDKWFIKDSWFDEYGSEKLEPSFLAKPEEQLTFLDQAMGLYDFLDNFDLNSPGIQEKILTSISRGVSNAQ